MTGHKGGFVSCRDKTIHVKVFINYLYLILASKATLGAVAIIGSAGTLIPLNFEIRTKRENEKSKILTSRKQLYDQLLSESKEQKYAFFENFQKISDEFERVRNGGKYKRLPFMELNFKPSDDDLEMFSASSAFVQAYLRFNQYVQSATVALNQFSVDFNPRIPSEIEGKVGYFNYRSEDLEWEHANLKEFGLVLIDLVEAMERLYWREIIRLLPRLPIRYRVHDLRELKSSEKLFKQYFDHKIVAQEVVISKLRHPSRINHLKD